MDKLYTINTESGERVVPEEENYKVFQEADHIVSSATPDKFLCSQKTYVVVAKPVEEVSFYYSSAGEAKKQKNLQINGINESGIYKIKSSSFTE